MANIPTNAKLTSPKAVMEAQQRAAAQRAAAMRKGAPAPVKKGAPQPKKGTVPPKASGAPSKKPSHNPNDPYYPTDYNVGKKKKVEAVPMKKQVDVIPFKRWVGVLIVCLIPLVNFIALCAWTNKKNPKLNPSQREFAKAGLIALLVFIVLAIGVIAALQFALGIDILGAFGLTL